MTEVPERAVVLFLPPLRCLATVIMATASWYSASHSSSEASFASRTCTSSFPSSGASTAWVFDARVHLLAKHGLEEPPWAWRLSVRVLLDFLTRLTLRISRRSRPLWIRPSALTSSSDQVKSQHLSVFASPGFHHTNRAHLLRPSRSLPALLSGATRVWTL